MRYIRIPEAYRSASTVKERNFPSLYCLLFTSLLSSLWPWISPVFKFTSNGMALDIITWIKSNWPLGRNTIPMAYLIVPLAHKKNLWPYLFPKSPILLCVLNLPQKLSAKFLVYFLFCLFMMFSHHSPICVLNKWWSTFSSTFLSLVLSPWKSTFILYKSTRKTLRIGTLWINYISPCIRTYF